MVESQEGFRCNAVANQIYYTKITWAYFFLIMASKWNNHYIIKFNCRSCKKTARSTLSLKYIFFSLKFPWSYGLASSKQLANPLWSWPIQRKAVWHDLLLTFLFLAVPLWLDDILRFSSSVGKWWSLCGNRTSLFPSHNVLLVLSRHCLATSDRAAIHSFLSATVPMVTVY